MAKASTAVAHANKGGAVATADFSAFDGIGTGFENVTSRDLLIPRLAILQGLSPQVTQGQAEFDKDARVGEIYDIGLKERFPNGVIFLPVYYDKAWLEWAPRESKKGLQKIHTSEAIMADTEKDEQTGRMMLKNGNHIMETAQFYGYNVSAAWRKTFLPMASTQLKKGRQLLTLATSEKLQRADGSEFTPPLFYRSYALSTIPESNNKGNWMGWKMERGQALTELRPDWSNFMEDIKEFRQSLAAGTVKGDISDMEHEAGKTIDGDAPM